MIKFPAGNQTVGCLLDVLTTTQRLTAAAGAAITEAVHAGTDADGWRRDEIVDSLDTLVEWGYLTSSPASDGVPTVYFPGARTHTREI